MLISLIFSCRHPKNKAKLAKEASIDSLNKELSTNSNINLTNLVIIKKLIATSDSMNYTKGFVESSLIGYMIYFKEHKYPEAWEMLESAKKMIDNDHDPYLLARLYYYMGEFQVRISNNDIALSYFQNSLENMKKVNDTARLKTNYRTIGIMFLDKQNWPMARKYLWQAYLMDLYTDEPRSLALNCMYLGSFYDNANKRDSAELFYGKANQIIEKLNDLKLLALNLNNWASFEIENGAYDLAENKLRRALKICDSMQEMSSLVQVIYLNLGSVYNKRKQYSSAKTLLEKALISAESEGKLSIRININKELYLCNKELKNYQAAFNFIESYQILKDSNDIILGKHNLGALEMKYNYARLVKEQEVRTQRNKLLFAGVLIASGFIIVLLVLLYQKQLIKVKNFKLQQKILGDKLERNNSELASHVLHMVSVNERKLSLIQILKEQLPYVKKDNQPIVRKVIEGFESDQDEMLWKEFEVRFTEVHKEFYFKLAKLNPNLTLNEKRLCAFLLLNMTSKEIMCITGQSIKAIEQARFRLRKQLGITNNQVTLSGFLSSL